VLAFGILSLLLRTPWVKVFLDTPDRRKMHQRLVPRLGGLGVILASVVVMSADGVSLHEAMLATGGAVFLLLGLLDDSSLVFYVARWLNRKRTPADAVHKKRKLCKFELKVRYKLFMEVTLAVGVVWVLDLWPSVLRFGDFNWEWGWVGFPVACLWLIGAMNAFNLVDGIDGLCGGLGLFSLLATALLAYLLGDMGAALAALAVAGALVGFMVLNVSPARIFMGDMGSLFVGFTVGVLGLKIVNSSVFQLNSLVTIFLAGLPVFDVMTAIVRRYGDVPAGSSLRDRLRRIVGADSNHIHHRMLYLGLGHLRASIVLYVFQVMLLTGAVLLVVAPPDLHFWVFSYLVVNVGVFFVMAYNGVRMQQLRDNVHRMLQGLNDLPWRVGVVCSSPELADSVACQSRLPFEFFHFGREDLVRRQAVSLHAVLLEQLPDESVDSLLQFALEFQESWNMPMALVVSNRNVDAASLREHPYWKKLGHMVSVYNRPLYIWPLLLELLELLERHHVARPTNGAERLAHTGNGAV